MEEKLGRKFILKLVITLMILLISTSILGYIMDGGMYYGKNSYKKYCNERFTNAGLIRNCKSEVVVFGSSMMENTDIKEVRKIFNSTAKKCTMVGMTVDEMAMLLNAEIDNNEESKIFIINLDLAMFNSEEKSPYARMPKYMYDNNKINDIKYLLSYDIWTKFIPFNIVYNLSEKMDNSIGKSFVETYRDVVDIDTMGAWHNYAVYSEDKVKTDYLNNKNKVSEQNVNDMFNRMKDRFDTTIYPILEGNKDREFELIMQPYSALMWVNSEKDGYKDQLLEFKKYVFDKTKNLSNVNVYDFQSNEGIVDLNNYKDSTHYNPKFNDMMIRSIKARENLLTTDNIESNSKKLEELVNKFKEENKDWLYNK